MNITRPAGRALSVGELRDALASASRNDVVRLVVAGTPIDVDSVDVGAGCSFLAAEDHPVDSASLDLLVEIVEGAYTLKQAKVQAAGVLRSAGIEVEA